MSSDAKHHVYGKNQLVEVICQLRFPEICAIQNELPAEFRASILQHFPRYIQRQEAVPPRIIGTPGQFHVEKRPVTVNHQFSSSDDIWRINLTSNFISLSCGEYTNWDPYAQMLDLSLAHFIKLYSPSCFERVGLRYINAISRNQLGLSSMPFRELIVPKYLGILSDPEIAETNTGKSSVDAEYKISNNCHAKIHAGPGHLKKNGVDDGEIKFIFDLDLYTTEKIPVNYSAGTIERLHSHSYPIFRNAITDLLHHAMKPE